MNLPFEIILEIIKYIDDNLLLILKNNIYFINFKKYIKNEEEKRTIYYWKKLHIQHMIFLKKNLLKHFKDRFMMNFYFIGEFRQIFNIKYDESNLYNNVFNFWWNKKLKNNFNLKDFKIEENIIKIKKKLKKINKQFNTNYFDFEYNRSIFFERWNYISAIN